MTKNLKRTSPLEVLIYVTAYKPNHSYKNHSINPYVIKWFIGILPIKWRPSIDSSIQLFSPTEMLRILEFITSEREQNFEVFVRDFLIFFRMHELFLLLMCPAYALTTDSNFSVTGCNDADNIPEMTLRIQKQYFVDNLSWQSGFTLTDDDTAYEKKIPENQLLVDLSDQCKFFD